MELLNIKMLNTAVERVMNRELAELGLTYTQASVIGYLAQGEYRDLCQRDIEEALGLTHPTVSSILSRMEASGLVTTEPLPADRRHKVVRLTEQAAALSTSVSTKYNEVKARLYDGVSPAQRALVDETVQRMLENMR